MINTNLFFYYYTPYATQATAQRCNSECRAELAPAMPSASSVDNVNAATFAKKSNCEYLAVSEKRIIFAVAKSLPKEIVFTFNI